MGIGTFLGTTAGVVIGGGIGALLGASFGIEDVDAFIEAVRSNEVLEASMEAASIAVGTAEDTIFHVIDETGMLDSTVPASDVASYFENVTTENIEYIRGASTSSILSGNNFLADFPVLSEKGLALLDDNGVKAYEFLQNNWETYRDSVSQNLDALAQIAPEAAIGTAAGAAVGGYAGYKLSGGGQDKWSDKVAAQRAAQTAPQLG